MRKISETQAKGDTIDGLNTEVIQEKDAIPRIETHTVTITSGNKLFFKTQTLVQLIKLSFQVENVI